eukprot:PhF_6_TR21726/c0_g1_i1/m.31046
MSSSNLSQVNSKIIAVTVFPQRAQIQRSADVDVTLGENIVEFSTLPKDLDRSSLQVSCLNPTSPIASAVTLKSVTFTKKRTVVDNNEKRRNLEKEIAALQEAKQDLQDQLSTCSDRQTHLQKMFGKAVAGTRSEHPKVLEPEAWESMVQFEAKGTAKARQEQRQIERNIRDVDKKILVLSTTLNTTAPVENKTVDVVQVSFTSTEKGNLSLSISYIIPQASWTAYYDVRVDSDTKKITMTYNAMVQQHTTEDWSDVAIELSTAQTHISGAQPELQPQRIQIYVPPAYNYYLDDCKSEMLYAKSAVLKRSEKLVKDCEDERCMPMPVITAKVSEKATSFVFSPAGVFTIPCNSSKKKITLSQGELKGDFVYVAVPKRMQNAYLRVKVVNTLKCPMMQGDVNVFMDNNYVATSSVTAVPPDDTFDVWLGIDNGICVKHKLLRKATTEHGSVVTGRKKRVTYEYLINVTNSKQTMETFVIKDQIPVSSDGSIVVTLVDPPPPPPKPANATDTSPPREFEVTEADGTLTWTKRLVPDETMTIKLIFHVQCNATDNLDLP